jgi:hypothetical protein
VKSIRNLLGDRKRSQRGSVLSGVLIITAFLSILGGALMNELTTGFLLSRVMVNRVNAQATVNSAVEIAIDQIQTAGRTDCPTLAPLAQFNNLDSTVSYEQCVVVPHDGSTPIQVASGNAFDVDATRLGANLGRNGYLVADHGGQVSLFDFGQRAWSRHWSLPSVGKVSAPPTAMLDSSYTPAILNVLVPLDRAPKVCPNSGCVALLSEGSATVQCYMNTSEAMSASPIAAKNITNLAYMGDDRGNLYAFTTSGGGQGGDGQGDYQGGNGGNGTSSCQQIGTASVGEQIVGLFARPNSRKFTDEIYVVTKSGLVRHFTFNQTPGSLPGFTERPATQLNWSKAVGVAQDAATARLAVTFAGGGISTVQVQSDYSPLEIAHANLGGSIAKAPYWCRCPSGDLIGTGLKNGTLDVRTADLKQLWTFSAPKGVGISATPGAAAGTWFFAADDGFLYEVLAPGTGTQVLPSATRSAVTSIAKVSMGGPITSSPIVDSCPVGICVYLGTTGSLGGGQALLTEVDTHSVSLTACVSVAAACQTGNPQLWVSAEVGNLYSQRAVRVRGWSYYSG